MQKQEARFELGKVYVDILGVNRYKVTKRTAKMATFESVGGYGEYKKKIDIRESVTTVLESVTIDGTVMWATYIADTNNESTDAVERLSNGSEPDITLEDAIDKLTGSDNEFYTMVVEDIEDFDTLEDAKMYLSDVSQYGCISGTVSRFIYTADIQDAFNEYGEDAFEILEGADINLADFGSMADFIQAVVWTSYEVMAGRIHDDIEDIESGV